MLAMGLGLIIQWAEPKALHAVGPSLVPGTTMSPEQPELNSEPCWVCLSNKKSKEH